MQAKQQSKCSYIRWGYISRTFHICFSLTLSRGVVCPERRATFKIWIPMRLWNAVGNIAIPTKTQMKSRVINGSAEIFANTRVNDVWRFLVGGEKWGGSPLIFIHGSLFATSFIIFTSCWLQTYLFLHLNKTTKNENKCIYVLWCWSIF